MFLWVYTKCARPTMCIGGMLKLTDAQHVASHLSMLSRWPAYTAHGMVAARSSRPPRPEAIPGPTRHRPGAPRPRPGGCATGRTHPATGRRPAPAGPKARPSRPAAKAPARARRAHNRVYPPAHRPTGPPGPGPPSPAQPTLSLGPQKRCGAHGNISVSLRPTGSGSLAQASQPLLKR